MLQKFLLETELIDFGHPEMIKKSLQLFKPKMSDVEKAKVAYEFVRDEIPHYRS